MSERLMGIIAERDAEIVRLKKHISVSDACHEQLEAPLRWIRDVPGAVIPGDVISESVCRYIGGQASEIRELKRELEAARHRLERWIHGEQIAGDYVCPDSLELTEARAAAATAQDHLAALSRVSDVHMSAAIRAEEERDAARAEVELLVRFLWRTAFPPPPPDTTRKPDGGPYRGGPCDRKGRL